MNFIFHHTSLIYYLGNSLQKCRDDKTQSLQTACDAQVLILTNKMDVAKAKELLEITYTGLDKCIEFWTKHSHDDIHG